MLMTATYTQYKHPSSTNGETSIKLFFVFVFVDNILREAMCVIHSVLKKQLQIEVGEQFCNSRQSESMQRRNKWENSFVTHVKVNLCREEINE